VPWKPSITAAVSRLVFGAVDGLIFWLFRSCHLILTTKKATIKTMWAKEAKDTHYFLANPPCKDC
jgi:hypothetical protein